MPNEIRQQLSQTQGNRAFVVFRAVHGRDGAGIGRLVEAFIGRPIVNVGRSFTPTFLASIATSRLESNPPLKNAPTRTSLTMCRRKLSLIRSSSSSIRLSSCLDLRSNRKSSMPDLRPRPRSSVNRCPGAAFGRP